MRACFGNRFEGAMVGLLLLGGLMSSPAQEAERLKFGWIEWDPYQYGEQRAGDVVPAGLDIELIQTIAGEAGLQLDFENRSFGQLLEGLEDGSIGMAIGFKRAEREAYCRYSFPLRLHTDVILVRRELARRYDQKTLSDLTGALLDGFRIGTIAGYSYGPKAFAEYLVKAEERGLRIECRNAEECFEKLRAGDIDGFVMDRMVGATVAWRNEWIEEVETLPLVINQEELHVLFSKRGTTERDLERFNQGLANLEEGRALEGIMRSYLQPILISMTTGSLWFLLVDIVGTVAFALSGVMLAARERFSIVGALVLATLPAVGGGITRDLLLGRDPVGFLRSPLYAYLILGTVVTGYLFLWIRRGLRGAGRREADAGKSNRVAGMAMHGVELFDALGLGAFVVTGVAVAVSSGAEPLWLWGPLMAALTGAGGGILRDVVRGKLENSALKTSFYPEVALFWGLLLSLYLSLMGIHLTAKPLFWAVLITLSGALLTRMLIYALGWKAPVYAPDPGGEE